MLRPPVFHCFGDKTIIACDQRAAAGGSVADGIGRVTTPDLPGLSAIMVSHRAVLIVDVQRSGQLPKRFLKQLQAYAVRFPCRIFTRFINLDHSLFRRLLKQTCCSPGAPDTQRLIVPSKGDLVINRSTDGLTPAHIRRIKARGIKSVTVCGLDTDTCVLGVMFSLFAAGIACHLKDQMCGSSSGLHQPALAIILTQFPKPR